MEWEKINREELISLYCNDELYCDHAIAKFFCITKQKVRSKRKKLGISRDDIVCKRFLSSNSNKLNQLKNDLKQEILSMDISKLSSAISHYVFRNGPVEDMHAEGKLDEDDMKALNIYMNDRIATLIALLKDNDWLRIALFIEAYGIYGSDWDKPVLQTEELDSISAMLLKMGK